MKGKTDWDAIMDSYPLSVQTAYQDLLASYNLQAISDLGGTPFLKDKGERGSYWYTRQRIGDRVVDRYIGRNTEEIRQRIAQAKDDLEGRKMFDKRCGSIVAQLRAAGMPAFDRDTGKVLNAMARAGTFRMGGTLVGTHAFRLYGAELGVRLADEPAVTYDVDIASFENLKLAIDDEVAPSLSDTFDLLKLSPAPGLARTKRSTRWVMRGGGMTVDFLAPRMQGNSDTLFIKPLGVYARALSFLNFLIAEPIAAVGLYRNGVLVQIPQPERYAVHKLIVAERRIGDSNAKARKDLTQSEALIEILAEDRPGRLRESYETAMSNGPKWRSCLNASLAKRPRIAAIIESLK